jgi:uncharacterized delta-60 repeat protein
MPARFTTLFCLLGLLFLQIAEARAGIVNASWDSVGEVPVTVSGNYDATGLTVNFTLNFAPAAGTNLTVVRLTGLGTINGTFANLAQNQAVALGFGGQTYPFVANYNGGPGNNDLVLQWAGTRALAWGNNFNGQLGNGSTTTSLLPAAVTSSGVLAGKTILALSAGASHSMALCSDGTVAAWGSNSTGQIGANGGSQSSTPVIVSTLGVLSTKRVIAIAAGANHSLALCADGTVAGWGANTSGQLGNGGGGSTGTPVAVNTNGVLSGKKVVAIAAGQSHSMALCSDGTVAAWGANASGQLGNKSTTGSSLPVAVYTQSALAGKTVTAIAAGQFHSFALCSDGTLATWGDNADGQLGNNSSTPSNIPVAVTTAGTVLATKTVTDVGAGGFHSLALCSDGTVATWGQNTYGQLGITSGSHYLPNAVATSGTALAGKTVTAIAGGFLHSLALCSDGTLTAWGLNASGQLGTGNTSTSGVPVAVSTTGLSVSEKFQVPASGANAQHSLAIVAFPYVPPLYTTGTLISNGSFETGFTNWSVSDVNAPFSSLRISTAGLDPPGAGLFSPAPTDGTHAATSGFEGTGPSVIRLSHDVAVTGYEPFLRFDWRAGWNMLNFSGSTLPRTFAVTIEPVGGGPVMQSTVILTAAAHTKNLDTGSQAGVVDLSAFIGTTVRVCFDLTVPETNTGPAYFQLDNVRTAALLPATVNPITRPATALALHGATLNGIVNAGGLNTAVDFQYGTDTTYGGVTPDPQNPYTGTTDSAASATVSGLAVNTTYHYRVRTTNSAGTKYGADATFTTLPLAPVITFPESQFQSYSSVAFNATVNPNGASTVVTFEYGPTTAYGSSTPAWEGPFTVPGIANGQVSGVPGGVPLYWKVTAQNAGGIAFFEGVYAPDPAPPGDPTVTTLPPTLVERRYATLHGTVNANGSSATVDFDFGPTTFYSSHVNAYPSTVSGSAVTAVGGTVNGLSPGTTYHCRTRAYGPNGYVFGPDVTFSTPPIGFPAASTDAATGLTLTSVFLNGYASANNGPPATVSFDYGPDTNYGSTVTVGNYGGGNFDTWEVQIPISGDAVTYHYRIKAKNNIGTTFGQDMTFTTIDSHEARLYGLTLGSGALTPAFDRNVFAYTLALPFEATSLWLLPTASTGIGSVTVNGIDVTSGGSTGDLALNIGDNVFHIVVTALDGTTQQTYTITVTRPAPVAGNLDLSFNGTGMMSADLGGYNYIYAMAVQPDGKIVTVGAATNGMDDDFAVARFNPDGSPDTTFGGGTGRVLTDFAGWGDNAAAVAVQGDGRIVVAGLAGNGVTSNFGVARYNADGTPDTTFNGTGKVITQFPVPPGQPAGASASCIAVQSDGKILVAGYAENGTDNDFAIVRYHGNILTGPPGTLDTSFGAAGVVTTDMGGEDYPSCMTLQGDGKILLAGAASIAGPIDSVLARYNADGTLDPTFNGTGKVIASLSTDIDSISAIAVQSDGKIVAAGLASNGTDYDFVVARFHGNIATGTPGTLDTTFNGTGKTIAAIGSRDDFATGVALQSDGKIVVAGTTENGSKHQFAVLRYKADGTPDTTFHGNGIATADFGSSDEVANCMVLQDDGKILVGGSMVGIFNDFAVARFLGDGPGINVQTDAAENVFDGLSTVKVPSVFPGANTSVTFTIQNTGTANLTGLGITLDGADNTAFDVTTNPVAPVTPFSSSGGTSVTVRFTPASRGTKHATMHITSNVPGSNGSYDIALTGTGLASLGDWRQQFLGTANNTGDAADDADPYHTGVPNLAVFAILGPDQNPATVSAGQLPQPQFSGPEYGISFTQPAEVSGVTYGAEWSEDLAPGNWHPVSDTGGNGIHTFMVPIGINTQIFMRLNVTRP